jgi:hypothetical protein
VGRRLRRTLERSVRYPAPSRGRARFGTAVELDARGSPGAPSGSDGRRRRLRRVLARKKLA